MTSRSNVGMDCVLSMCILVSVLCSSPIHQIVNPDNHIRCFCPYTMLSKHPENVVRLCRTRFALVWAPRRYNCLASVFHAQFSQDKFFEGLIGDAIVKCWTLLIEVLRLSCVWTCILAINRYQVANYIQGVEELTPRVVASDFVLADVSVRLPQISSWNLNILKILFFTLETKTLAFAAGC